MTNLGYSHIAIHPGELIKEELQSRGISQKHFSEVVGLSYPVFNDVLNGKRPLSTNFALTMEAVLSISADLLVNMQTRYNLQIARQDENNILRLKNIRNICATML